MEIAYVSRFNSVDISNWSGSEYYIAKAIGEMAGNKLHVIAGLEEQLNLWTRIKFQSNIRIGKRYHLNRSPYVVKQYAEQVAARLVNADSDIIFSPGTMPIAYLKSKQPKVFYTDATFAAMINYYDWYKNLSKQTIKEGIKLDQQAIDSCALAIFSSEWAAQSAIKDYGASPDKVKVVPLGANITVDPSLDEIKKDIETKAQDDVCKILFIGVDWERKGGDTVLKTVELLNNNGIKTELHIIGLNDLAPKIEAMPYVYNHGFFDKSNKIDFSKFEQIIKKSHFLLLPSQAEAYGLVFCEAAAYGVPSIATKTGGITTIIRDNVNGRTFDLNSPTEKYAEYIANIFSNKDEYKKLAFSSYQEYKNRLNWNVSGNLISDYLKELL